MFGRLGIISTGPRPTPSWMQPGSAFHIKPRTWSYINGTEFTSFTNLINTASAAVFARASDQYGLTSAGTFTRFASGVPAVTDLGLLVEPEETALGSQGITMFGRSVSGGSAVAAADVFGATNASRYTANGASAQHSQNSAGSPGGTTNETPYLLYAIVSDLTGGFVQLVGASAYFSTQTYVNYTLSGAGTVGSAGTNVTSSGIQLLATGKYLIWLRAPATATASSSSWGVVGLIPASTSSRLNSHTSSHSVTVHACQLSEATRWGSPIDTGEAAPDTREKTSFTIKPAADTYDITFKFGDGTADQTVTGVVIDGDGYEIPTDLNGRFITDIIGVLA